MEVVARPAWFTRQATGVELQSKSCELSGRRDYRLVTIVVRNRATEVPGVRHEPEGSSYTWEAMPDLPGKMARELHSPPQLLGNWSPRLESLDGTYNSHAARDKFGWAEYSAKMAEAGGDDVSRLVRAGLRGFVPRIVAEAPVRNGDLITLRYRIYGWTETARAERFVNEIGVSGDGFLRVEVPLPRGEMPGASR